HPLVGEFSSAIARVVGEDLAVWHTAAFHYIEELLVGGETQAVRTEHAFGGNRRLPRFGVQAANVQPDISFGLIAFLVDKNSKRRVGERDGTVGFHHHVVWRVEALALKGIDQHTAGSVVFRTRDAAAAVLAADEPPLAVAGMPVGEIRRPAVDAHRARLLFPFENAVVGDVAPQEIAPVTEIDGSFRPATARSQPLDAGELEP